MCWPFCIVDSSLKKGLTISEPVFLYMEDGKHDIRREIPCIEMKSTRNI